MTLTLEQREKRRASWRKFAAKKRAERTAEEKAKHNADTLARRNRQRHDPEHRERYLQGDRVYDRKREAEADSKRNQREEVKARRRDNQSVIYQARKDCPEFRAAEQARSRENYQANPEYYIAKGSESSRRKKRTFGSLSPQHKEQVVEFYRRAKQLTEATGIAHEVDHVVPINGENVSGLHVPWNLQILTRGQNRAKGNRHDAHD